MRSTLELKGVDCSGLDTLNVKVWQTGLADWENLTQGTSKENLMGLCQYR